MHRVLPESRIAVALQKQPKSELSQRTKPRTSRIVNTKATITAILALILSIAGYAQQPSPTAKAKTKRGAGGAKEVGATTATAKVNAVDPAKRTVTLVTEAGETDTYALGKNVRNLDQIKVGDQVKATFLKPIALAVRKWGEAPIADEMPGVVIVNTKEIAAKIVSTDPTARTVTVEGALGGKPTFKAGPNVNLDQLQQGDAVTLRATDGFVIRISRQL